MATHDIEARLSRWLLRARDLAGSDTLHFTQDFLAEMLGVRRSMYPSSRTPCSGRHDQIRAGKIQIVNLDGLQETACECYGTVKSQYQALLGGGGTE